MPGEAHTHTLTRVLNRHSRNINCVVVAVVFEHISSTRQIICRFRFTIEDDLAVSSVQACRSGLPNYLRLWPTVLRLGETSAKHLLRLKRVPVLIPLADTTRRLLQCVNKEKNVCRSIFRMCVCVCACTCVHVCVCVCMYVCMYVRTYVCMHMQWVLGS